MVISGNDNIPVRSPQIVGSASCPVQWTVAGISECLTFLCDWKWKCDRDKHNKHYALLVDTWLLKFFFLEIFVDSKHGGDVFYHYKAILESLCKNFWSSIVGNWRAAEREFDGNINIWYQLPKSSLLCSWPVIAHWHFSADILQIQDYLLF